MNHNITQLLEALVIGDTDFAELERSGGGFCSFEAIGMIGQEIRHAKFLGYCLDPRRPHGFGSAALAALLRAAASSELEQDAPTGAAPSPLEIHLMDLADAEVRIEHRRIDLMAIVPAVRLVVAAELKISAFEHSGQLGRYRRIVEEGWPASDGWRHLLVFLTLQGDPPSDDGAGWIPVRMDDLARELDETAKRRSDAAGAPLLAAYVEMLRRHHLTDEKLERLAERLWSRHREALDFLADRRPDSSVNVLAPLYAQRDEIAERLSADAGFQVVADDGTPSVLRFAVPGWDDLPGMREATGWTSSTRLLLLEVRASGDKRSCRVHMVLGPGPARIRQRLYDALAKAMPNLTTRKQITERWTRLATDVVIRNLLNPDLDPDDASMKILDGLRRYSAERLPAFDQAVRSAPFATEGLEPVR